MIWLAGQPSPCMPPLQAEPFTGERVLVSLEVELDHG